MANHYISNKHFTEIVSKWVLENSGKESRKDWTQIPREVAEGFMILTERYSQKGNWRNYTWLEEQKSEALLNCVKYCHNFDPNRKNAFAYFTEIIYRSFLQILDKEKDQSKIKYKAISESSQYNYENIQLENNDEHNE